VMDMQSYKFVNKTKVVERRTAPKSRYCLLPRSIYYVNLTITQN